MKQGRYLLSRVVPNPPKTGIEKATRCPTKHIPVSQRQGNFNQVRMVFDEGTVSLESRRCMTCGSRAVINYVDDCQLFLYCEMDYPQKAIWVSPDKKVNPIIAWS